MVQKFNDFGICSTCVYRSGCIYLRDSMKEGKPVLQCEEFNSSGSRKNWEDLSSVHSFATASCDGVNSLIPRTGVIRKTLNYFKETGSWH